MKLKIRHSIIFLFLAFLFVQSDWAQSNWTIEQIANGGGSDIEVGPDGVVHLVYEQRTLSGKGKNKVYDKNVYYVAKVGDSWSIPISLGLPDFDEQHPSLDVDKDGIANVVFTRYARDDSNPLSGVLYYWNSSPDFTELVPIDDFQNDIAFPGGADIVVGPDGRIHIALSATNVCCVDGADRSNIYYTSSNDGISFDPIVNLESSSPLNERGSISPSIDIDEYGNIGILFTTYWIHGEVEENTFSISYTNNNNGSFFTPIIIFEGGIDAVALVDYPPLKLADGIAYLLYNRYNDLCGCGGYHDLLFAKLDAATGELIDGPIVVAEGIDFSHYSMDYQSITNGQTALHLAYVGYYNAGTEKNENWKAEVRYVQLNPDNGGQLFPLESVSDGWEPTIAVSSDGDANISFTNEGNVLYAINSEVVIPPDYGVMHISDIVMSTEVLGSKWNAIAQVFVQDEVSVLVNAATVTGEWSGLVNSISSTTTSDGIATLESPNTKKNGTITFTVTDVTKDGWTYDRDANFAYPASGEISSPLSKQVTEYYESALPDNYALFDNYPNPFNPSTKIKYSIPEDSYVRLKVYDVLGKEISSLVNEYQQPGYFEINFDASDLSNGIYLYILKANEFVKTKKMLLMK